MANDTYPIGYIDAREKFSRRFLHVFDQLISDSTPGIGTAFMTLFLLPIGLLAYWAYSCERESLYNNLIVISRDKRRLELIDQDLAINALADKIVELRDLASMPIEALKFILRPDILNTIQQDVEVIKQKKQTIQQQLSALTREARKLEKNGQVNKELQTRITKVTEELEQLETVAEKLRKTNYSSESLARFFQEPIPKTVQTKPPEQIPLSKQDEYQAALIALKNTLPLIKNDKILTKTVEVINQVELLKKQGYHPKAELIKALSQTLSLLQGKIMAEDYEYFAKQAQGRPSMGMKILGGIMIALGILVITTGIILAATGVGIVAGLGTAAAGAGIGGLGATFFAQRGLSKAMSTLQKAKEDSPGEEKILSVSMQ